MSGGVARDLLVLTASVAASTAGQTCLKLGLNRLSPSDSTRGARLLVGALGQPLVITGLALFGVSVLLWMLVLARTELSWSYPLLGLSYVFVALSGRIVFGEHLSVLRVAGIGLVLAGAAFISVSR
jgi:multidrug transporter EmrE-like cation transporter